MTPNPLSLDDDRRPYPPWWWVASAVFVGVFLAGFLLLHLAENKFTFTIQTKKEKYHWD